MTLKLVLPFLERGVEWARVAAWHKREGEYVSYGEAVCDVVVEEVVRHSQPPVAAASLLEAPPAPLYQVRHRGVEFRLALVASDAGFMRNICVAEGEESKIGAVLAFVTTDKDEEVPDDDEVAAAPTFHLVANLAEPNTIPPPLGGVHAG